MKLVLATASLVAVFSLVPVASAHAWTRGGHFTTWRGTYYGHASGGCCCGTCSRSASITGPNGRTASRSGSVTRIGPHDYSYSRTTTGPRGNSVTRGGTVAVYPSYRY